jgi:DNA primase
VRLPQDHAARMLLLDSDLWHRIGGADHELLCGLETWHGSLFRWLERELTEHGHREWPELRQQLADEEFADTARALVDGAELQVQPTLEELQAALDLTRRALQTRPHLKLLGRA